MIEIIKAMPRICLLIVQVEIEKINLKTGHFKIG
jgi:hypothetical protein